MHIYIIAKEYDINLDLQYIVSNIYLIAKIVGPLLSSPLLTMHRRSGNTTTCIYGQLQGISISNIVTNQCLTSGLTVAITGFRNQQ